MKRLVTLISMLVCSIAVLAQGQTSTLLEIGNEKISKEDFMKMYLKNNSTSIVSLDRQDLENYLDLFINYKLKLIQARENGLDTTKAFLDEVAKYRKQVAEPYINDRTITDSLIQEAYDRELEILRASHVLITLPANAAPSDTLAAYNKALMVRNKALKGEDFAKLAMEYSDDPSAKDRVVSENQPVVKGNGGDLGYFTSMLMIYSFESACYSMQKGDISMPIRTNFGYHIIKLTDRKQADFSSVDLKHVLVTTQNRSEEDAEKIINEAYSHVNEWGIDSVASVYSDDERSAKNSGWLIHQRCNSVPPEFIDQMSNMKAGELSVPFKTRYGWHFFRLVKRYPIPTLEEEKKNITQRISKDQRAYRSIESFIQKSKDEYGFKEYKNNLTELQYVVTDSVFSGNWQIPSDFKGNKVLFTIGDSSYTQMDMLEELYTAQRKQTPAYIPTFLETFCNSFADNKVFDYANDRLEDKYEDLRESMQSFREGILIFSITDQNVWNKSLIDSVGVQEFYNKHQQEYIWGNRADVTMWNIDKSINIKKVLSLIKKCNKKGLTNDETKDKLIKKFAIKETPSKYFTYTWNRYEKGANRNVDKSIWNTNIAENLQNKDVVVLDTTSMTNKNMVLVLKSFLAPQPKSLDECKGIVTSQYQEYLEEKWIKELRSKYPYKVNLEVFNSVK